MTKRGKALYRREPLTAYEKDFVEKCRNRKLKVVDDGDSLMIIPKSKKFKEVMNFTPWGPNEVALEINCKTNNMKLILVKKILDLIPDAILYIDVKAEATILMNYEQMDKVLLPLKFRSPRKPLNLTQEQKKAIGERLRAARSQRT